jgi:hypothetical protein
MAFGGYEVGTTYNRRRDIHGRFGGQMQGGICTPKDYPVVIAFTGASGRQHGYADGRSWDAQCTNTPQTRPRCGSHASTGRPSHSEAQCI